MGKDVTKVKEETPEEEDINLDYLGNEELS